MRKIGVLLLLIASFAYSQEQTIKFETEVQYMLDKQQKLFCISQKNPETILVKTPQSGLTYLIQNDQTYSIAISNGKIDYGKSTFKKMEDGNAPIDIIPTDSYEDILNFKCRKFTFNEKGLGFEVFIAVDHKLDNTSFLSSNFKINKESFNIKGLLTKLNIVSNGKTGTILMIEEIRNSEGKLSINNELLKKLQLN